MKGAGRCSPWVRGTGLGSVPPPLPGPLAQRNGDTHLSASISSGGVPAAQRRTIQAASKAARKPLATPVPSGQKGCEEKGRERQSWSHGAGLGGWEEAGSCWAWLGMKAGSGGGTHRERMGDCLLIGTAASGMELGCSSTLNPPQVSSGAGEGDNLAKASSYWDLGACPKARVHWAVRTRSAQGEETCHQRILDGKGKLRHPVLLQEGPSPPPSSRPPARGADGPRCAPAPALRSPSASCR